MKIGNNGNLVLGPFDESTPCLMIVLMNCQTKLRINLLTAVKSVTILEIWKISFSNDDVHDDGGDRDDDDVRDDGGDHGDDHDVHGGDHGVHGDDDVFLPSQVHQERTGERQSRTWRQGL
ncbi:hypothetical protein TNCV_715091 [Trichonephila clavipes]|nr:hypothetical protein TNCV_715091 [Trichonephila clavipes]